MPLAEVRAGAEAQLRRRRRHRHRAAGLRGVADVVNGSLESMAGLLGRELEPSPVTLFFWPSASPVKMKAGKSMQKVS